MVSYRAYMSLGVSFLVGWRLLFARRITLMTTRSCARDVPVLRVSSESGRQSRRRRNPQVCKARCLNCPFASPGSHLESAVEFAGMATQSQGTLDRNKGSSPDA